MWLRQFAIAESLAEIFVITLLFLLIFFLHTTPNKAMQLAVHIHGRIVPLEHFVNFLMLPQRALRAPIKILSIRTNTFCLILPCASGTKMGGHALFSKQHYSLFTLWTTLVKSRLFNHR